MRRPRDRTAMDPGTESARLAPKRIASRPASTDMQDSDVDGPHTTGMHRTSYRLHTPELRPNPPATGRASSFSPISLAFFSKRSTDLSLSLYSSFFPFAAILFFFFLDLNVYQLPLQMC